MTLADSDEEALTMRYYAPILRRGKTMPPPTRFEEKFGGLPWGSPPERWPSCKGCDKPQSLIAQLAHDATRLDLGGAGRALFVFQCNHDPGMCETWSGTSGANASIVLDASDLKSGLTATPSPATAVEEEALGGIPSWIQGEDEGPEAPWRWVAQLDWQHALDDGTTCDAANYGDAGMAYVYVNTVDGKPAALMFWQCG